MTHRSPYKYLDYYTFEDADLFFGREEETQKMVGEILSTRLLVLFSPSGSGKTSFINAGVRPALERFGYQTVYVRLESEPFFSVQSAIAQVLNLKTDEKKDDLYEFIKTVTSKTKGPLVIFIDQFEEFFIFYRDKPLLRQKFIQQVAKVKYDDQLSVFLVLSLREDYFVNLHEFREAIPSIFQNNANVRLEPFTDEEARRVITLPLKVRGFEIEDGLVDTLIRELKKDGTGILPIRIQIVCHTLWNKKPPTAKQITYKNYVSSGRAENILNYHLSKLLRKIPLRQQGIMLKVFSVLKTPDNTKRFLSFEELQQLLKIINPKYLMRFLAKLSDLNLIRHEQRGNVNWYEFKHDYIVSEITNWLNLNERKTRLMIGLYDGSIIGVIVIISILIYLGYKYYSF